MEGRKLAAGTSGGRRGAGRGPPVALGGPLGEENTADLRACDNRPEPSVPVPWHATRCRLGGSLRALLPVIRPALRRLSRNAVLWPTIHCLAPLVRTARGQGVSVQCSPPLGRPPILYLHCQSWSLHPPGPTAGSSGTPRPVLPSGPEHSRRVRNGPRIPHMPAAGWHAQRRVANN